MVPPCHMAYLMSCPNFNRAILSQTECPCESCKVPLYSDTPSKQIQCSGPSDVNRNRTAYVTGRKKKTKQFLNLV